MTGYETQLGSALITMIDPDRGSEVEFNRWYERDHFYGGALLGPGVIAGTRYVARDSEKRLRLVVEGGDPNRGTMLALYWLADNGADYWQWCTANINVLAVQGRMTAPGRVRNVWWLPNPWTERADADGVPSALALDRRFPALVLAIVEGDADVASAYREQCARELSRAEGVALVVGAGSQAVDFKTGPVAQPGPAQAIAAWFLESESHIESFVDAHEKTIAGASGLRTAWLSPFVATVPGTDAHLDRLWL